MLNRLKRWGRRLRHHLSETGICLALGIKDSLRWHLLWRGTLLAALVAAFWLVLFVVWRGQIWDASLLIGGTGVSAYLYPFIPKVAPSIGNVGIGGAYFLAFVAAVVVLSPIAATSLIVVFFLGLVLLSFRCLTLRSLLPRVKACIERQYPDLRFEGQHPPAGLSWLQHLRLILTAVIGTAACLLLPLTGGLFLLLWIGYLSTRSIALEVMKGATTGDITLHLIRRSRLPLTLVGSCMTLFLLVPFLGLIAPTAMTAAAAHLMKRLLEKSTNESAT